jgi:hypothetical protein
MNLVTVTSSSVSAAADFDDLVIEQLTQLPAEEMQSGTCICWTPGQHA